MLELGKDRINRETMIVRTMIQRISLFVRLCACYCEYVHGCVIARVIVFRCVHVCVSACMLVFWYLCFLFLFVCVLVLCFLFVYVCSNMFLVYVRAFCVDIILYLHVSENGMCFIICFDKCAWLNVCISVHDSLGACIYDSVHTCTHVCV